MNKEIKEELRILTKLFIPYTQQTDSLDGELSDDVDAAQSCALICVRCLIMNSDAKKKDYWRYVEIELLKEMRCV